MNSILCFLSALLNHLITSSVFFHWFSSVAALTFVFMISRICLLILPISGFVGLISLHLGLFQKFGLWSLSVMKACFFCLLYLYNTEENIYCEITSLTSCSCTALISLKCSWRKNEQFNHTNFQDVLCMGIHISDLSVSFITLFGHPTCN